jgi:hypothetical protein
MSTRSFVLGKEPKKKFIKFIYPIRALFSFGKEWSEAHNVDPHQKPDSDDSLANVSEHSSDREFVADDNSQGAVTLDASHPCVLLAQKEIRAAGKLTAAPDVISTKSAKHLPVGFCEKGHRINSAPTLRKGRSLRCSYCEKMFSDGGIFNCSCYIYACIHCLADGKTSPAPPSCPRLDCVGACITQWKAIATECFAGKHPSDTQRRTLLGLL